MRTIRSSVLASALVLLSAAAHAAGEQEVRRAAALLDYVARGYAGAVSQGRVINAAEFEEQAAFAQEAAELLGRQQTGQPFAAEARLLEAELRAKAAGVPAHAASLQARLLAAAHLDTTPPPEVQGAVAPFFYGESCAACHGAEGRGDGPSAKGLSTRPTDFTGPDRAELTPYRVYSAITHGVPRTAMPSFDQLSEQHRWLMALYSLTFGTTDDDARRGQALAMGRGLAHEAAALVAQSDADLRPAFAALGFGESDARALLAWVRRIAPFARPPAQGFPELRNQVSVISISYVHDELGEARDKLSRARQDWSALEPLVESEPSSLVRAGFAEVEPLLKAPGANTRVLRAVAQLAKAIAEAPPEQAPDAAAFRRAGIELSLSMAWPAALALATSVGLALRRRPLAALATGLVFGGAAISASRAMVKSCAVVAREFQGAAPAVSRGLLSGAASLAVAGLLAGVVMFAVVKKAARAPPAAP